MNKQGIANIILKVFPNLFNYRDFILDEPKYYLNHKKRMAVDPEYEYRIFEKKNKNVFFGYYDLKQDWNGKYLVHVVDTDADPRINGCEIGYYDDSNVYHHLTETDAWCWQQGARLRWNDLNSNEIVFNNYKADHYVTEFFDIQRKAITKSIDTPLYDICFTGGFGLSLDFSRLQRLRPGYGYSKQKEISRKEKAPHNSGLFQVSLERNEKKLLISLAELACQVNDANGIHYLNHISLSPGGKRATFFHIWKNMDGSVKNRFMLWDFADNQCVCLEDLDKTSHYTWKNDEEVLVTMVSEEQKICYYAVINVLTKKKTIINPDYLKGDGHPSYLRETMFVSDTYRNPHTNYQELFLCNYRNPKKIIAYFYHSPFVKEEMRCDLHPRITNNGILVDTIFYKKQRSCVLIRKRNGKKFYEYNNGSGR